MSRMLFLPSRLQGKVAAIPSKSQVHRLLIAAALADLPTEILLEGSSQDIAATVRCLRAMGADIKETGKGLLVKPLWGGPSSGKAACGESGSTLRFLLPVAAAIGYEGEFTGEGRLPKRPLSALENCLSQNGVTFSSGTLPLCLTGRLLPGRYTLPGNISSQYISGLLFALPLLAGDSEIVLTSPLESAGYVQMTLQALSLFSVEAKQTEKGFWVRGGQIYKSPGRVEAEGDWSGAAFFLAAGALGGPIEYSGLPKASFQRDKEIVPLLKRFGAQVCWQGEKLLVQAGPLFGLRADVSQVPDLVPALAVVAAFAKGESRFENAGRLRLKESDRLAAAAKLVCALGGAAAAEGDALVVRGGGLSGGAAEGEGDHRMVMAAAVAAAYAAGPSSVTDPFAVAKSYPFFFDHYRALGGKADEF